MGMDVAHNRANAHRRNPFRSQVYLNHYRQHIQAHDGTGRNPFRSQVYLNIKGENIMEQNNIPS